MKPAYFLHLVSVIVLALLFCVMSIPAVTAQADWLTIASDDPSGPAEVEAFLDRTLPANLAQYNVPGATVAVVKDGELVLAKGYGYTDIGNKSAVGCRLCRPDPDRVCIRSAAGDSRR
jgi:CubicO group peptidase (beta-lactamase class C family)